MRVQNVSLLSKYFKFCELRIIITDKIFLVCIYVEYHDLIIYV